MTNLTYAIRRLLKAPGFTAVALLTLALGIGLNAAMFNIINSMVLQPLKFADPEMLFRLERVVTGQGGQGHRPAHFVEIARSGKDFVDVACTRPWSFTLSEPGRPAEVLDSLRASAGFFKILGVNMALGREFSADEDKPGSNQVVILSHAFWISHFEGNRDVIGKTLRIDGQPTEIIGVAPAVANDPRTVGRAEIYRPLALTADEVVDHVDHAYAIFGRYRAGVTPVQAEARFATIAASLRQTDASDYDNAKLEARSLKPELRGTGRQIIFMLVGLSAFVLLIACANLANLLLARAIAQTREFSIRGALGASRSQLIRPLITECSVLACAGGGLGVLVCVWTNAWMAQQFAASGNEIEFALDWRLLLFAFGTSLVTALFFGVAPAWTISHVSANDTLKSGTRGSTGGRSKNRFRQALIVTQFALALVLLSGAVFFVRGVDQLLKRESGWQPAPLLRGILSMPAARYPDPERMMRFYERVQDRVSALPGVAAAAISYELPAFGFPSGRGFIVEGQPPASPGNQIGAPINGVTPGYFATVGTRLLRGRDIARSDRANSPRVIVINETMARTLFPGQEALGHRIAYSEETPTVWMEIVGVAEDVQFMNFGYRSAAFQTYIPLSQATWSYVSLTVRASVPPATLMDSVRRAVGELDADMAIKDLMPVPVFIERTLQDVQAINHLLIGFAGLGLFLAALGIYSVIARLVAQRTNEIGIRMALGAQMSQVVGLILAAGMRVVTVGLAIGLVGAIALSRFLGAVLVGIQTSSVLAIGGASAGLIGVALIACWLPARRAAQVDPMTALRVE